MFEDIKNYRDIRKRYNYKMFKSGNEVFRKFSNLEAEVLQNGALDRKNKELVALGISIVNVCYGCIEYHITMAMENGATRAEIADAVAVSVVMAARLHNGLPVMLLTLWNNWKRKKQRPNNYGI